MGILRKRYAILAALIAALASVSVAYAITGSDLSSKARVTSLPPVLVDGSGNVLGPLVDSAQFNSFYSSSLNLLVALDSSGNIMSPTPTGSLFAEYYTTSDCTGTPYGLQSNFSGASIYTSLLKSYNGNYYRVDPSATFSNLSMHTTLDPGKSCDVTTQSGNFVPLEPIQNIPYSDPLPDTCI